MKRSILLLSILGVAANYVQAEIPTVLDTVVVSATRSEQATVPTPASISVITAQDIAQSGAKNVAELLRGRAGIQVSDLFGDGSGGAVFDLRGFGATAGSNTLIMVDGRRLNNGADIATPDVTTIALNNIERIEIIQGSAGTLFGNQAVGGVINIITRRPQEFHADMDLTIGSYNSRTLTASISDRFDNGISYRLAAVKRSTDNYRDNNSLDYHNLVGRIDYDYISGRVFAEINRTNEDMETPAALFADEVRADRRQSAAVYVNDFQDTDTALNRIGLSHFLSDNWSLDMELAYRDVDRVFASSFRSGAQPPAYQTRDVYTFTPRLVGTVPMNGSEAQFTIGADLEMTDYYLNSSMGTQEVDQRIYAYYLQGVLPINDKWSVTAGARRAKVRNHITDSFAFSGGENLNDEITVGTLGVVFRPNHFWRLFARADENFRFAKVDEHTSIFGATTGLNNQTGISYEVGGEWTGDYANFKATAYRLKLEDEISYDPALYQNVNLDSTMRKGVILEASAMVHQEVEIGFNYHYVDAKSESGAFDGNRVPLVAEHSATLLLDYRPLHNLNMHAEIKYVGDQVLGGDFANGFPKLDDFTVVNINGEYRVNGWSLGAKVNNLFDKEYSDTGSTGYTAGFTLADAYFPAPERNFWLTAGYEF
ncbi:MAG: TonB-dependent receptor [Gammaproteobacteria bacterium]|nr:TonB-dependent receptor [Gammaproteobacteria bacterium]